MGSSTKISVMSWFWRLSTDRTSIRGNIVPPGIPAALMLPKLAVKLDKLLWTLILILASHKLHKAIKFKQIKHQRFKQKILMNAVVVVTEITVKVFTSVELD